MNQIANIHLADFKEIVKEYTGKKINNKANSQE